MVCSLLMIVFFCFRCDFHNCMTVSWWRMHTRTLWKLESLPGLTLRLAPTIFP